VPGILQFITRASSLENHSFIASSLGANSVVIDLGANTGFFTREISKRLGVRSYGIEANPNLCEKLKSDDRTTFHNVAICDHDGPIQLNLSNDHTSSSVVSNAVPDARGTVTVQGVTLAGFMKAQGISKVDLLKVDIEGAEVPLFKSLDDVTLKTIPQISIEFHDDHGFITPAEGQSIRDRLVQLGFWGIKFASNNTNWLFYQPGVLGVGKIEHLYMANVVRNVRGGLRRFGIRPD